MESFHSASDLIKIRRGGGGNGTPFQIMLPVSIYIRGVGDLYSCPGEAELSLSSVRDIKGALLSYSNYWRSAGNNALAIISRFNEV